MAWHETDDFWEQFREVMFHDRRWGQAEAEVDGVLRLSGVPEGGEVLDLCCGPGRHAIALGKRGFRVTGVDRTASYIESARTGAREAGVDATFLVDDARSYRDPDHFDLAICLYTSFGYFASPDEDLRLLTNVCDSLKPGGAFVIDMNGKEVAARAFQRRSWEQMENGAILLEERTVGPGWEWIENRWILVGDGEKKEMTFRVRMYSGTEMASALRRAGFGTVELYGDWEGAVYDERAHRLIAVGRT